MFSLDLAKDSFKQIPVIIYYSTQVLASVLILISVIIKLNFFAFVRHRENLLLMGILIKLGL